MTLPSFNEGDNLYGQPEIPAAQPPMDVASERYRKVLGLRQKIGQQILREGAQVARGLVSMGVSPDVEVSEVRYEPVKRLFRGIKMRERVLGQYSGWKLVQVEKTWDEHANPRGEERAQSNADIVPAGVAINGIALLTDGRFMPYEVQSNTEMPPTHLALDERGWADMVAESDDSVLLSQAEGADENFPTTEPWDVQYNYIEQSQGLDLAYAIVRESQVSEEGQYDDRWPMHDYMRQENALYVYDWRPTEPGSETGVYGHGIRSGLISLAKTHGVSVPE